MASPDLFERLVENSRDLYYRYRLHPTPGFEFVSQAALEMTGYTPEDHYADPGLGYRLIHPDDRALLEGGLTGPPAGPVRMRWVRKDGRILWTESVVRHLHDEAGVAVALEGVARDITAQMEAEDGLRRSREQMRALAARLDSIREDEKAKVSRDLHDEMGQLLTALKMNLRWVEHRLEGIPASQVDAPLVERVVDAGGLVDQAIASVRRIAAELRPAVLDRLGLEDALRLELRLLEARTGLRCQLAERAPLPPEVGGEVATALYRIAVEALTNVARHARAAEVSAALAVVAGEVVLTVADDGCGPPAGGVPAGALGIAGMRERADRLGGTLEVARRPGAGTVVTARIPI